jgi:hypothetical protein
MARQANSFFIGESEMRKARGRSARLRAASRQ